MGIARYTCLKHKKLIPSGPGALWGADLKMASFTSVSVTSGQGKHLSSWVSSLLKLVLLDGGSGNMQVLNISHFCSKSVADCPSTERVGVFKDIVGLVYLAAVKIS